MALVYPVAGCIREFGKFGMEDGGVFFYNVTKAIVYSLLLNSGIFLIAILICCYLQDVVRAASVTAIIIFALSLYLGYGMMLQLPVAFLPVYQIRVVVSRNTFFQPAAILAGVIWSGILILLSWIKFRKCDLK
jgi:ABC-2 type transport system permease protein